MDTYVGQRELLQEPFGAFGATGGGVSSGSMTSLSKQFNLSQIQTSWTVVRDAKSDAESAVAARNALLQLYRGAVRRYLMAIVRDEHVAEDLTQEFSLRFLRGDFRNADPARGRFRNFVKTAVLNLVRDEFRKHKKRPSHLSDAVLADLTAGEGDGDDPFVEGWKQELLSRAWSALQSQQDTELPLYDVLRFRAEHPQLRSPELAAALTEQLGKPVNANWVRQVLYRARHKFAEQLLMDIAQSLDCPTREQLEDELRETGLYQYCASVLPP